MSDDERARPKAGRIASMDQFRGYTVAGMLLVNFLGPYAAIPPILKHNNNHFSYADSIMPSFLFACGFSYRLSALRRLASDGPAAWRRKVLGRSFGLVLVSLVVFGVGSKIPSWSAFTPDRVGLLLARLIKADLWEVLAIIGVAQAIALPVIARGPAVRAGAAALLLLAHLGLSYAFNFDFVTGGPNPLDDRLGTSGTTAWDGGLFGLLPWSAVLLAGSLAYDVVATGPPPRAAARLVGGGVALMAIAYGLSCLSRLYDGESPQGKGLVAASPVWPPLERAEGRPLSDLLAEPPFVQPPGPAGRPNNYWMMNKRVVSTPFTLFGAGFAAMLYGLFVAALDPDGRGLGLFGTFGRNALAAYVLHHLVETQVHAILPKDAPLVACLMGLAVFSAITYGMVRALERQGVFVRL